MPKYFVSIENIFEAEAENAEEAKDKVINDLIDLADRKELVTGLQFSVVDSGE